MNLSNSDVQFIVGLAHFQPQIDQSTLLYYTSVNQINGNALGFIDFTFRGKHQFGSIVNDSSTSGIFYFQNTTTTLENYYFLNNKGAITYVYGNCKGNFVNCVFSQKAENLGNGFGETIGCLFEQVHATSLAMSHLRTAFCAGEVEGMKPEQIEERKDLDDEKKGAPAPQIREDPIGRVILIVAIGVIVTGIVLWKRLHRRLFGPRRRK